MRFRTKLLIVLTIFLGFNGISKSQTPSSSSEDQTVDVFLDCRRCSETYIRNELTYINYVRNKEDAELHLLITRQSTGSGGFEYTMRFIGSREYEGQDNTYRYISSASDTQEERQQGLVNRIGLGLVPYLSSMPVIKQMEIRYEPREERTSPSALADDWNYWVFEVYAYTSLRGEQSQNQFFLSTGADADRISEELKIRLNYDWDYDRRSFDRDDSTDIFITRGQELDGTVVQSLSDHWSVGIFAEANRSTRNNIELGVYGSPAVEYNLFPYREYAQREFSIMYSLAPNYYEYQEETIYGKMHETLVRQRLRTNVQINQPWGEFEGRLDATTFLHDFTKNRFEVDLELDVRIFRGLSFNVNSRYAIIHDQLYIPKGDISDAEQLLNLRQQSTSYSYRVSMGIAYSFGSIYNNIVNPRF
ncbi:hypothetical protein [Fodinibius sediminis]|uniref:DUF481 domain-containing protein n=1 Tax=Fodinibius sediminis TaxID=1214077 RepID=A0A521BX26_9BACT|nr:hypothetical protein [Fodinibius sediminis]SMO51728.1 hypothetical protein SAMN06265218_104139 [Fodinibius sediminis]